MVVVVVVVVVVVGIVSVGQVTAIVRLACISSWNLEDKGCGNSVESSARSGGKAVTGRDRAVPRPAWLTS